MKKKLMLLGGGANLVPVIEKAHEFGYHVMTVDYLPNNVAHSFADEYHNVSILDLDKLVELAKSLQIDGVMTMIELAMVPVAYVAEKLGLNSHCPYETAIILHDKALFRKFLTDNGFKVPHAKGFSTYEEALKDIGLFHWPVIIKPVDSCSSRGVIKVEQPAELEQAVAYAQSYGRDKTFIIEDFIETNELSSGVECFAVNGQLEYAAFYDQYHDVHSLNPYVPVAECWPSIQKKEYQEEVSSELQRLFDLLHIDTGMFNVEWRVGTDGTVYLMEVAPRPGMTGKMAKLLEIATGVKIYDAEILNAVGDPIGEIHQPEFKGCYAISVLHSKEDGIFRGIDIDKEFRNKHVIQENPTVKIGDHVKKLKLGIEVFGTIFLRFDSQEEMHREMADPSRWLKLKIDSAE